MLDGALLAIPLAASGNRSLFRNNTDLVAAKSPAGVQADKRPENHFAIFEKLGKVSYNENAPCFVV